MANNNQDSRTKTENNAGAEGEVAPLKGRQNGQSEGIAGNETTKTQALASESKQDGGFSFSDILSLRKALYYLISKALHYLVLLVWPKMPERYRRRLPLFVALAVVLIGIGGYLVHRYWVLFVGIPDICGTVYNDSNVLDAVPSEGLLYIYELQDSNKPTFNTNFQIRDPQVEMGNSENVSVKPQEKRRIELRLDKNTIHNRKELYKYYLMGNKYAALIFFPGQMREYTPKRIQFNEKTLKSEKPMFSFRLIGKDIPAFYGTVFNASNTNDAIPVEGQFGIYEMLSLNEPIHKGRFKIEVPLSRVAEDPNVSMRPWQERRIKVMLDQTKKLYSIYRKGNAGLKLTFFPNNKKRKCSLESIKFNRETLEEEEPVFAFDLIGKETQWTSPRNQICFLISDSEVDPNCRRILKGAKRLLEQTLISNKWFLVTDVPNFNEWSEKFAYYENKHKSSLEVEENRGHQRALRYREWPTIVRVALRCTQMDSHMNWSFHVTDALNRIPESDRVWSEKYSSTLDFHKATQILSIVRDIVVKSYPIRGEIQEVYETKNGDRVAVLNVGSLMGVQEEMPFLVLPEGTVAGNIGTVKIRVVVNGEESRGFLTGAPESIKEGACYHVIYGGIK
jgi:hypothetical protein